MQIWGSNWDCNKGKESKEKYFKGVAYNSTSLVQGACPLNVSRKAEVLNTQGAQNAHHSCSYLVHALSLEIQPTSQQPSYTGENV